MINFRELANALAAHPDIWLGRNRILPGASPAVIERAETILGAPLHPELKAFYTQHNGLAIEWMFKHSTTFQEDYCEVDTSELPLWEELLGEGKWHNDYIRFEGRIIILPLEDIFIKNYKGINKRSLFSVEEPFASECGFISEKEWEEELPTPPSETFTFGEKVFESEMAFRAQLRYVDAFFSDTGNLLLLEEGVSNPILLHLEDYWTNFEPKLTLPLSQYLHRVAYDFGLSHNRHRYFRDPKPVPTAFDVETRLAQLIEETEFHGDLREDKE